MEGYRSVVEERLKISALQTQTCRPRHRNMMSILQKQCRIGRIPQIFGTCIKTTKIGNTEKTQVKHFQTYVKTTKKLRDRYGTRYLFRFRTSAAKQT